MLKRLTIPIVVGLLFTLLIATHLFAGGWVVVTLDELPRHVRAGEAVTVGFKIRQHGQTLINLAGAGPTIEATHAKSHETMTVVAEQSGFTGHYSATLRFPTSGQWRWQISPKPFPGIAVMPPLWVSGAPLLAVENPAGEDPIWQWWVQVQKWIEMVFGTNGVIAEKPAPTSEVTYGRDLFIAKGCVSCHVHTAALLTESTQSGPDLTAYQKTATFLHLWLADPTAVKPTAEMPNLGLSRAEIDALAAFLTATEQ